MKKPFFIVFFAYLALAASVASHSTAKVSSGFSITLFGIEISLPFSPDDSMVRYGQLATSVTVGNQTLSLQDAANAQRQSQTLASSAKMVANSMAGVDMVDRYINVKIDHHPRTGLPLSNKCAAVQTQNHVVDAADMSRRDRHALQASFAVNRYIPASDWFTQQHERHTELYCSVSEAKQGMCELKPNAMQGFDSNYAAVTSEPTLSPEMELAGYDYITNLVYETNSIPKDCATEACQIHLVNDQRRRAVATMVSYTLLDQIASRRVTTGEVEQ